MTTLSFLDGITVTEDVEQVIRHLDTCPILRRKAGNPGRRNKPLYLDCVTAFDIETSTIHTRDHGDQAFMYIWQWAFSRDLVLIGRTWDKFLQVRDRLDDYLETRDKQLQLVTYVFNLSYEFQFLKGIYRFEDPEEVFCMDRRKVLRAKLGRIDMRCAYIHSNMNLDTFTRKMGCTRKKQVGSLDYRVVRYPWTELTEQELRYCIYDVAALVEALEREMALDHDTIETIPLTSTGYVRRDAKAAIKETPHWWHKLHPIQPDLELYTALREGFRGGYTHCNRFYNGCIVDDVRSVDRSSSYPDVLVNHRFPMSEMINRGPISLDRYHINVLKHHKAALIRIAVWDIELKDHNTGAPYLSRDKCRLIHGGRFDNGMVLSAHYLEMTVTDIDMRLIEEQYRFKDPCIFDSWFARYDFLPETFRELIREYYRRKTQLKGAKGEDAIFYGKFKNKLNALYGMTAQNILKPEIIFDGLANEYREDLGTSDESRLAKQARKAFLPYQIGVWVTAWARWELFRAIREADDRGLFVYSDTDSVKYVGIIDWTPYNSQQERRSRENGATAIDPAGVEHVMGVYEQDDGTPYISFRSWGSKKYAYVDNEYHLHVTVSGVNKEIGAKELSEKGGITAFEPDFVFHDAGGTDSIYNDDIDFTRRRKGRCCA